MRQDSAVSPVQLDKLEEARATTLKTKSDVENLSS